MDICEYAEKVLGIKLLDYQKELLKKIDESSKENKELRFIPAGRGSKRRYRMLLVTLAAIAETYEKEATDDERPKIRRGFRYKDRRVPG